ncbi:MAG TPA: rhomboid family intramembrane serine protease [Longimicrobiales bacterium]|nr:rhomboid family intramembrane serine protease [Longimicrobiales bacterium]
MGYRGQLPFAFALTPWVKRLLIANAAVFFALLILDSITPGLGRYLAFAPAQVLYRPWTVLTYMFVHAGFWHLFFNLLALFFFGPPLEGRWGSDEFIKFYLVCGLGGAALSFVFAWNHSVVGASAAVYGVMLAFAMTWPDSPIYIWGIFPVKAKWLVLILVGLSLLGTVNGPGGMVAHAAHLGGFAAAYLYLKFDRPLAGHRVARLKRLFPRHRLTVIKGDKAAATVERPAVSRRREEERLMDEVDRVLDKISTSGLASLTPDERRLLDEVSRRYRQN